MSGLQKRRQNGRLGNGQGPLHVPTANKATKIAGTYVVETLQRTIFDKSQILCEINEFL